MTIAKFINSALLWLVLLAFTAQLMIDFSTVNIATSCIIFSTAIFSLLYFRLSNALETHPLSSFAIFGFLITSQLGALFAQSSSMVAVSENLRQPILTFSLLAMYQAIAIFTHMLYRIISNTNSNKPGLVRNLFQLLGIYATPSVINLWIIGFIGLLSLLFSNVNKVAGGLSFLAWAPFLIPIYVQKIGPNYCNIKKNYIFLVLFAMLIVLLAIAFNARAIMLSGIATVLLLFLLFAMRSNELVTFRMVSKLGLLGLFGLALSWPASNMVTAMVVARKDRGKVPITKIVTNTFENFLDPEKLSEYSKDVIARDLRSAYDETYIKNPLIARFVITKFHDNTLYFAGQINDKGSEEVWKISKEFFWATLPQPWLDELKIDVDKEKHRFSMGDIIVNQAVGVPLGGFKTGSVFGQGYVMFGKLFPVIYFFMCLILFVSIDIFSTRTSEKGTILSAIGMLHIWPNFLFGITAESLHHLFNSAFRDVVQSVFLFAIVFAIAKLLSNVFLKFSIVKPNFAVIAEYSDYDKSRNLK